MGAEFAYQQSAEDRIYSRFEQLRLGKDIIKDEANALHAVSEGLDESFCAVAELLFYCRGSVIVTGMGKAGLIGQKITATLGSTGTSSHFLHPSEALHGDLGRVHRLDCCILLSFSGGTEEVNRLVPTLREMEIPTVAITATCESELGRSADHVLQLGKLEEACPLGLAPSTSTTAMLAMGDALALVVSRMRGFQPDDFARFHPGGSLGRKLAKVDDWVRPLSRCRVALDEETVRNVLVSTSMPGRRSGAIMLINRNGQLTGIFTDSDLAKLMENCRDDALDCPVSQHMSCEPQTVQHGTLLSSAVESLRAGRISDLPVVDEHNRPLGILDVTDILHLISDAHEPVTLPFPNSSPPGA